jgi:hypothetical protein
VKITVRVEQKHIDEGCREEVTPDARAVTHCMVALALTEQYPQEGLRWRVGYSTAWLDGDDKRWFRLPNKVRDRIHAFMDGKAIRPFEFELEV